MKNFFFLLTCIALLVLFVPHVRAQSSSRTFYPKIGTVHYAGRYPDRSQQDDYLLYGARKTLDLGFHGIEVWIMRTLCRGSSPGGGAYRTRKYCAEPNNLKNDTLVATSLTEQVQHPDFVALFNLPFRWYHINAQPLEPSRLAADQGGVQTKKVAFTEAELNLAKKEYYDLTRYLLSTYKQTGETFILQIFNEVDWRMLAQTGCIPNCKAVDPPDIAIENAKAFINAAQSGVAQARNETSSSGVKVVVGCEINSVPLDGSLQSRKRAINTVLPFAPCDLIGYSAYGALADPDHTLAETLQYIDDHTQNSSLFEKNVFVSELGVREGAESLEAYIHETRSALNWGVPFFIVWTLYGTENGCGFCMVKPDGSLSSTYTRLQQNFTVAISPSPTPTPIPGDLIDDEDEPEDEVNIYDYNRLVSDFGKTGSPGFIPADINRSGKVDIFDYNILVGNFWK